MVSWSEPASTMPATLSRITRGCLVSRSLTVTVTPFHERFRTVVLCRCASATAAFSMSTTGSILAKAGDWARGTSVRG